MNFHSPVVQKMYGFFKDLYLLMPQNLVDIQLKPTKEAGTITAPENMEGQLADDDGFGDEGGDRVHEDDISEAELRLT